jgi:hypothetical protein
MKVVLDARVREIRGGIEARVSAIRLAGHGSDIDGALESARIGVLAWCIGLRSRGRLEPILNECGIVWEGDPNEIEIQLKIVDPMGAYEP